jgi:hypothetical protein
MKLQIVLSAVTDSVRSRSLQGQLCPSIPLAVFRSIGRAQGPSNVLVQNL